MLLLEHIALQLFERQTFLSLQMENQGHKGDLLLPCYVTSAILFWLSRLLFILYLTAISIDIGDIHLQVYYIISLHKMT